MEKEKKIYLRIQSEDLREKFDTISYYFRKNTQETMEFCIETAWRELNKDHPKLEKFRNTLKEEREK